MFQNYHNPTSSSSSTTIANDNTSEQEEQPLWLSEEYDSQYAAEVQQPPAVRLPRSLTADGPRGAASEGTTMNQPNIYHKEDYDDSHNVYDDDFESNSLMGTGNLTLQDSKPSDLSSRSSSTTTVTSWWPTTSSNLSESAPRNRPNYGSISSNWITTTTNNIPEEELECEPTCHEETSDPTKLVGDHVTLNDNKNHKEDVQSSNVTSNHHRTSSIDVPQLPPLQQLPPQRPCCLRMAYAFEAMVMFTCLSWWLIEIVLPFVVTLWMIQSHTHPNVTTTTSTMTRAPTQTSLPPFFFGTTSNNNNNNILANRNNNMFVSMALMTYLGVLLPLLWMVESRRFVVNVPPGGFHHSRQNCCCGCGGCCGHRGLGLIATALQSPLLQAPIYRGFWYSLIGLIGLNWAEAQYQQQQQQHYEDNHTDISNIIINYFWWWQLSWSSWLFLQVLTSIFMILEGWIYILVGVLCFCCGECLERSRMQDEEEWSQYYKNYGQQQHHQEQQPSLQNEEKKPLLLFKSK